ncbi:MAG: terminase small subunit [Gammaproteobacteria bacterium]|nr:terminase small subunit [Gammaproteobacteria bacterium]
MKKEKHWLNQTNMAASLGISTQAFSAWGVEPIAKIGRENFYTVAAVILNREERQLSAEDLDSSDEERKIALQLARIRLTNQQADALEMKNKMLKHEIAPVNFQSYVLAQTASEIRAMHDRIPGEACRRLNLSPKQILVLQEIIAMGANSLDHLADADWIEAQLTNYLREEGIE